VVAAPLLAVDGKVTFIAYSPASATLIFEKVSVEDVPVGTFVHTPTPVCFTHWYETGLLPEVVTVYDILCPSHKVVVALPLIAEIELTVSFAAPSEVTLQVLAS